MLVLTRKPGEKIHIGSNIILTVTHVQGNKVRLGIESMEEYEQKQRETFSARLQTFNKALKDAAEKENAGG